MSINPIAVVIPEEKFQDEELFEPLAVWQAAGIPFVLASTRKGLIIGDLGGQAEATTLIEELSPVTHSAIVVIGGTGTVSHLWNHAGLKAKIKEFAGSNRLASAICAGSVVLAQTGLIGKRAATTYPVELMTRALEAEGVVYSQEGLIDHGDVITASGPTEAADFGRAVAAAICS